MNKMKKIVSSVLAITFAASSLTLSGCADMSTTQRNTGIGAGAGAALGAVIGRATAGGNKTRSTATGAAIGAVLGAGGAYLWSRQMEEQRIAMEQAAAGTGVGVTKTADNQLKLDIPSDISFDSGRYDVKPNMRPILDRFASTLNQNPVTTVSIVGHTDNQGTDAVNNPLSVNRAGAVRDYLVGRGVAMNRISIDGRGSHQPIADNGTAQGRAMNRRVEIFVAEQAR